MCYVINFAGGKNSLDPFSSLIVSSIRCLYLNLNTSGVYVSLFLFVVIFSSSTINLSGETKRKQEIAKIPFLLRLKGIYIKCNFVNKI